MFWAVWDTEGAKWKIQNPVFLYLLIINFWKKHISLNIGSPVNKISEQ